MNAYQIRDKIQFYTDVSRGARWKLQDYENAFNDSVKVFIDNIYSTRAVDIKNNRGFQFDQEARDDIYTLIKTATPSLTDGTTIVGRYGSYIPTSFTLPTDYYDFISLNVKISGITDYCRPTEYNKLGPLLDNTFMMPTNKKTYYNENGTGITIWRGSTGTITTATLAYLKTATPLYLGTEANYLTSIVSGSSYIAVEETVYAGTTYPSGTQFTAPSTGALTSGQVILASNTTTTDMPAKVQETLCKMAASLLLGTTSNYDSSKFVDTVINKNN